MAITKRVLYTLCGLAVLLAQATCLRESYYVKLSGPVTVSEAWVEFQPQPPIKVDKDLQMVLLDLESPFKHDFYGEGTGPNKGQGVLMPDGEVINPEIEITDQNGNRYTLVWRGGRETFKPVYSLPYPNEWPRDRGYTAVRIRSPRPINCKAIYWFNESSKDWH